MFFVQLKTKYGLRKLAYMIWMKLKLSWHTISTTLTWNLIKQKFDAVKAEFLIYNNPKIKLKKGYEFSLKKIVLG